MTRWGWHGTSLFEAMKTIKTAKTIKPYSVRYNGWDIIVPEGSIVSNGTACGPDDSYRFWSDWHKEAERLTGFNQSMLSHNLTYYGLNVPAEYCEPYES